MAKTAKARYTLQFNDLSTAAIDINVPEEMINTAASYIGIRANQVNAASSEGANPENNAKRGLIKTFRSSDEELYDEDTAAQFKMISKAQLVIVETERIYTY